MFIWGSSFIALKSAMADLGEFTVIFFRMLIASFCFLYFIKGFLKYDFTKSDIKYILLLAIFEPCLYFIFEAKALLYTSASQAGMITSLMPLITAIAAGYYLKEIISRQLILGSGLAMIGAVWLSVQASTTLSAPNPMLGNLLELGAMFCAAGYTIVTRYLVDKYSALFITAIQAFIGAIFFFPFFIYEYFTVDMNFTIEAMSWLLYLGVVVTLCGYGLYNFALTKIEASKAAMFVNLIPVFTLILAFLILGEKLSVSELIASATILAGVLVSQISVNRFRRK
ncbi:MAG: EamA family transporter [Arcobacter sp.]|nr:MAG: EamA family transporter [Arcobacter sp.]